MNICKMCSFWTQHKTGRCSQKVLTTDGILTNIQTTEDYGCNIYEYDKRKMSINFWQDESGSIRESGTYSKTYLTQLIQHIEQLKKDA